jgi:hypothetical protein
VCGPLCISSIKTSPGFRRCPHFTRSSTTACTTRGHVSPHSRTRLLPSIQLSERLRPCSPLPLTHASPPRRPFNPSAAHLRPCLLLTGTHSPPAYGRRASCPRRLLRWRRSRSLRPRLLLRRRRRGTSDRRIRCSWGTCCCGRGSLTSQNSSASSSRWRRWSWCGATTIPRATSVGRWCRHAGERRRSAARWCGGAAVLGDSPWRPGPSAVQPSRSGAGARHDSCEAEASPTRTTTCRAPNGARAALPPVFSCLHCSS